MRRTRLTPDDNEEGRGGMILVGRLVWKGRRSRECLPMANSSKIHYHGGVTYGGAVPLKDMPLCGKIQIHERYTFLRKIQMHERYTTHWKDSNQQLLTLNIYRIFTMILSLGTVFPRPLCVTAFATTRVTNHKLTNIISNYLRSYRTTAGAYPFIGHDIEASRRESFYRNSERYMLKGIPLHFYAWLILRSLLVAALVVFSQSTNECSVWCFRLVAT